VETRTRREFWPRLFRCGVDVVLAIVVSGQERETVHNSSAGAIGPKARIRVRRFSLPRTRALGVEALEAVAALDVT
jgi:hypothetical protein